ncbi:MAG: hypothetical protein KIT60_00140 [Burkholderiaceae bacterium]|nr:hypothetical protein [Burkholderiaceae bacterium]
MNRTTIRATSAVLSVVVTAVVLTGLGAVADHQSAATSSEARLARRAPAASAPLQVATLQTPQR